MNKVLAVAIIACLLVKAFSQCEICFDQENLQNSYDRVCVPFELGQNPTFHSGQAPLTGTNEDTYAKVFRHAKVYDCPCILTVFSHVDFKGKTYVYDNYDFEEKYPTVPTLNFGFCGKSYKVECAAI